jgi:hypothetical protein
VGTRKGVVDCLESGAVLVVPPIAVATDPLRCGGRLLGRGVVEPADGAHPSLCSRQVVDTWKELWCHSDFIFYSVSFWRMTNFSWQDKPWAEFSTLEEAACHAMHLLHSIVIWPNVELKTWRKQLLGYLLSDIALTGTDQIEYCLVVKMQIVKKWTHTNFNYGTKPTGQILGRVFNSRCRRKYTPSSSASIASKQPNLKLKIMSKQHLGSLPLSRSKNKPSHMNCFQMRYF